MSKTDAWLKKKQEKAAAIPLPMPIAVGPPGDFYDGTANPHILESYNFDIDEPEGVVHYAFGIECTRAQRQAVEAGEALRMTPVQRDLLRQWAVSLGMKGRVQEMDIVNRWLNGRWKRMQSTGRRGSLRAWKRA